MPVSFDPPYEYSLHVKGPCPASTKQCRATWDGFVACCPSASTCRVSDDNNNPICCRDEADCRYVLVKSPHCANANWTMYSHQRFFCWSSRTILNPVPQTLASTTFVYSPTATSALTLTVSMIPAPAPRISEISTADSSSNPSGSHAGVIAGGVVGGVAGGALVVGLIWYLLRCRRQKEPAAATPNPQLNSDLYKEPPFSPQSDYSELPSDPARHITHEIYELSENTNNR
ncbi:hypothetical protein BDV23DRAFT_168783 [Aspergillus alliaceus]|uniref:Uncharacterized protein n=1 Tax=Petromyces alliaceus TaxID=209559 RepID=A0A5N7CNH2_PETAA|nr:hypothetical protein BDV23DRAFT_168783 [Aspergillus alliaceus]